MREYIGFRVRVNREYEDLLGIYRENGKENGNYYIVVGSCLGCTIISVHHQYFPNR